MRLIPFAIASALTLTVAADAFAQVPPPPPPTGGAVTPARGEAGRGGGRGGGGRGGRGGIQAMTLTPTGWIDGGVIPTKHTQSGAELSPALSWSGGPDSARSYVLLVHNINAPTQNQTGFDDQLHWLVWNIPGTATSLPEGVPQGPELPNGTRQISQSGPYYRGPAAPATGPPHHYLFELFALDTVLTVPPVGASPAATRAAVTAAMLGRVRGKGVIVGTWKRAEVK